MIIPIEQLSSEALQGLIESFIHREGTDYGTYEVSLSDKVKQVHRSMVSGDVMIIFDASSESVNLMTRHQYQEWTMSAPENSGNDEYSQ
jgi:uncharacterized protein YheU (UPF0270 family)